MKRAIANAVERKESGTNSIKMANITPNHISAKTKYRVE